MSAQTFPRGCKRRIQTYLYKFVEMSSRVPAMSYLSWRQIRGTDSYQDTDLTKHDFDLSNQTLNDY